MFLVFKAVGVGTNVMGDVWHLFVSASILLSKLFSCSKQVYHGISISSLNSQHLPAGQPCGSWPQHGRQTNGCLFPSEVRTLYIYIMLLVTTSKAPVTTSVALVTSSFLYIYIYMQMLRPRLILHGRIR